MSLLIQLLFDKQNVTKGFHNNLFQLLSTLLSSIFGILQQQIPIKFHSSPEITSEVHKNPNRLSHFSSLKMKKTPQDSIHLFKLKIIPGLQFQLFHSSMFIP